MADKNETPGAPPPPAPPEAPPPSEPYLTFKTAEDFQKRTKQASRAMLREAGLPDDLEAVKKALDEAATHKKQIEEAERARMSTEERLRADAAAAQATAQQAAAQAAEAARDAAVYRLCAQKGVANLDYAKFVLGPHMGDQGFDGAAYIDQLSADPSQRSALGMAPPPAPPTPPPAPGVRLGYTVPNAPGAPPPAPPAPNGAGKAPADATALDPSGWAARKRELGIG